MVDGKCYSWMPYDTGALFEAACAFLRGDAKVGKIYAATATR